MCTFATFVAVKPSASGNRGRERRVGSWLRCRYQLILTIHTRRRYRRYHLSTRQTPNVVCYLAREVAPPVTRLAPDPEQVVGETLGFGSQRLVLAALAVNRLAPLAEPVSFVPAREELGVVCVE